MLTCVCVRISALPGSGRSGGPARGEGGRPDSHQPQPPHTRRGGGRGGARAAGVQHGSTHGLWYVCDVCVCVCVYNDGVNIYSYVCVCPVPQGKARASTGLRWGIGTIPLACTCLRSSWSCWKAKTARRAASHTPPWAICHPHTHTHTLTRNTSTPRPVKARKTHSRTKH
jgi:hypothetical protein